MKRFSYNLTAKHIKAIVFLFVSIGLLHQGTVWGSESAGLSLNLYLEQSGSDVQFPLGSSIEIIMVIKNETELPIITKRGFSAEQFHNSLILMDQFNNTYTQAEEDLHAMPSAFPIAGRPMIQSEILPKGWVKSITITDIRELFPILKTRPGPYLLKAEQPFIRLQWGFEIDPLGMMGAADHPNNFYGVLESDAIPISITTDSAAQLAVRVEDISVEPPAPIPQVPVKVFRNTNEMDGYSLEDIWTKITPVLSGTTNFEGNATWETGSRCLLNENYTIIAKYTSAYGQASLVKDTEPGWGTGCTGINEKTISFGEAPQPSVPGDLDGDGDVDNNDYLIFRNAYGSCTGDPNFNLSADFDNDGCITMNDYRLFRSYAQQ